jgi:putative acetyltransferase
MLIRTASVGDASAMSALYRASVGVLGVRDYSPAQVAAWASLTPTPARFSEKLADGRIVVVAVDDQQQLLAFGDLEADGHIDYLYSAPAAAGSGAAAAVYAELERRAGEARIGRLYAEASEPARRFFLRRGFAVIARRDFEVAGTAIHNYAVEKRLA